MAGAVIAVAAAVVAVVDVRRLVFRRFRVLRRSLRPGRLVVVSRTGLRWLVVRSVTCLVRPCRADRRASWIGCRWASTRVPSRARRARSSSGSGSTSVRGQVRRRSAAAPRGSPVVSFGGGGGDDGVLAGLRVEDHDDDRWAGRAPESRSGRGSARSRVSEARWAPATRRRRVRPTAAGPTRSGSGPARATRSASARQLAARGRRRGG